MIEALLIAFVLAVLWMAQSPGEGARRAARGERSITCGTVVLSFICTGIFVWGIIILLGLAVLE